MKKHHLQYRQLTDQPPVVVIGHGGDQVQAVVGNDGTCVRQEQQLGTAHAVMTARSLLAGTADLVLVMNSDMPLLTARTLQSLVQAQAENRGPISILAGQGQRQQRQHAQAKR